MMEDKKFSFIVRLDEEMYGDIWKNYGTLTLSETIKMLKKHKQYEENMINENTDEIVIEYGKEDNIKVIEIKNLKLDLDKTSNYMKTTKNYTYTSID